MKNPITLGKYAIQIAVCSDEIEEAVISKACKNGYRVCKGRVGSMDSGKLFAAVSTAAKREGLVQDQYREEHAIYHSVLEAYNGICRGQLGLGTVLRSAGLVFSILRGPRIYGDEKDGDWLAVVLFGNLGAPIKGYEHEVIGLGMNPV